MDITTFTQSLQTAQTDAVLVDVTEDASALTGAAGALDQALGGALRDLLQTGDFRGKPNETALLYTRGAIPAPRVIAVGLGKADEVTPDRIRQAAAAGMKKARDMGCRTVAASLFGAETGHVAADLAARSLTEGALLGLYRWRVNHTEPAERAALRVCRWRPIPPRFRRRKRASARARPSPRESTAPATSSTRRRM